MRLAGCLLLPSGFLVVAVALSLLPAFGTRFAFILAGLAVESFGVWLLTQSHRPQPATPRGRR